MRRAILLVLAVCTALAVLWPVDAYAEGDRIDRWEAQYAIQEDGTIHVRWELDWAFGSIGNRGIILELVEREPWELDPSHDRRYGIPDIEVRSPSGAPATFSATQISEGR